MTAAVKPDGNMWAVVIDGRQTTTGLTNAQAWRIADKHNSEPINKREQLADWSFKQAASGQ